MTTLYFSPLACSLATRIALYEAGMPATFVEVDGSTKRTADGRDFHAVHPLGLVPALELDDGSVLTENAAILQYVAEQSTVALAPADPLGRARLRQWLSFVGTELHKTVYLPMLGAETPDGALEYALSKADARLGFVAARLAEHDYLLDAFSVADAYLFTVLHWTQVTPLELGRFPPLERYLARLLSRPAVARAVAEERELYVREVAARRARPRPTTHTPVGRK
jgi:glutathione S-transferase